MIDNFKTLISVKKELAYILDKKQKKWYWVIALAVAVSSLFELLGITVILPFIQVILSPDLLFENDRIKSVIDALGISTQKELMLWIGLGIILLYIIKNLYMLFSYYIQYDYATKVQKELSVKMLYSYLLRPYSYFLNTNTAEILRGCGQDATNVYNTLTHMFVIMAELLTITLVGGLIIYTDPVIALGILALLCIVMLGMLLGFKPMAKQAGKANREAESSRSKAIYEIVSGIKEIFVMNCKKPFMDNYDQAMEIVRKTQCINSFMGSAPDRIIEGICVSGLIGIVCIRLAMNMDMAHFIPNLAMFAMAAFKILPSIGKITSRINWLVYCRPSLSNVYNIMKEADKYKRQHIDYAKRSGIENELLDYHFQKELSIQHVFWQYEKQSTPVLLDVSLNIHRGEAVAFIGASGAGKTTLADIILGLFQPQKGSVSMDGIDVFAIPNIWSKIISYVPQSIFLTDDTVRNNVAFGIEDKDIDDKRVWEALEKAQLKEFIQNLPEGLDTIVGERGVKFSGGQRQRIAIARALYRRPEILILDEATAALDSETERAIMDSIDALQGQITMIIVAHRMTTIKKCDRIYEIKEGAVVSRNKKDFFDK